MMNKVFSTPIEALQTVFGYDEFRPNQEEVINQVINGQDGLMIMATGGGKSLTFQIPAMCKEGTTIVISPLIALMKDQVETLNRKGVSAGFMNSSLSVDQSSEVTSKLSNGEYQVFYVAPERLANEDFQEILKNIEIPLFAVDESHCISTWGKDFRLSYRRIPEVLEMLEKHKGKRIPRYAVTASATELIRQDIINELGMVDHFEKVGSFDRPNIEFNVRNSINKNNDVIDICRQNPDEPTIIYCATIKTATTLTEELNRSGVKTGLYHGQLDTAVKNQVQDDFLSDKLNVMVATNAFGMGVDKPNVRKVIHYQMPGNLENYYQEAGRAGRDGEESKAIMLYNEKDRKLQDFFIDTSFPEVKVIEGVQMFLRAFDDGMPIAFSFEEISRIAPDDIKDYQVEAILRILDDQGVIRLHGFEIGQDPTIEVLDAHKELNLDYLIERRKVVVDNLNIMDRFCRTKRCNREFLLDYFGEKQKEDECGHCGTCYDKQLSRGKTDGLIPDEAIRSALSLAKELGTKANERDYIDLLLGVQSRFFKARKLDQLPHFGSLSQWTKSETKRLVEHLTQSELLYQSPLNGNAVVITPKGLSTLSEKNTLTMTAPAGIKATLEVGASGKKESKVQKTNELFDHVLFEKLSGLRSNLSSINEKPPFMIVSDTIMKKIAQSKPTSIEELGALGMTPVKINSYGEDIIKLVSTYDRVIEEEDSMDVPY